MTQVYRTLRVAPADKGVLGVVIDARHPHPIPLGGFLASTGLDLAPFL